MIIYIIIIYKYKTRESDSTEKGAYYHHCIIFSPYILHSTYYIIKSIPCVKSS